MLRDPADRTLSLISYFFRPPFVRNPTLLAKARALLQDPAASTPAAFAEVLDAYDARFTDQTKGTGPRTRTSSARGHRKTRSRPLSWASRRP